MSRLYCPLCRRRKEKPQFVCVGCDKKYGKNAFRKYRASQRAKAKKKLVGADTTADTMSTGLNVSPDDAHLAIDNRIRIDGEIKTRVISVDELSLEARDQLLNIPAQRGPKRIAPTGWFRQ